MTELTNRDKNFITKLETIMDEDGFDYDSVLEVIGKQFLEWSKTEEHEVVKSLLESASDGCIHAGFDYYASTK